MTSLHFNRVFARVVAAVGVALMLGVHGVALGVTIETVLVGHPGNADDIAYSSAGAFGSVGYAYEIGTYEVTNDQYVEFLNAVAGSDFNSLYHTEMTNHSNGGIVRSGGPGGYSYQAKPNMGDKPVISVNLWDAARFVNWLHNGQPVGGQSDATTEDGVYDLNGAAPSASVTWERQAGATWFIPSEDEWYKAAYYDPREGHYWRYPTQSDDDPTAATANESGDVANPGPNVVNYDNAHWNGADYGLTTVGSAGSLSASYYGTYDQGGNIAELTESRYQVEPFYVSRGGGVGSMYSASRPSKVSAATRGGFDPGVDHPSLGFRVAKLADAISDLPGDFNGDGFVDTADYRVWTDGYGQSVVAGEGADASGDGLINAADYTVWRDSVVDASEVQGAIATPEPAAGWLAAVAVALSAPRSRRAFTLVELLAVVAIIGLLVALLLPAVQSARESARRTQCVSNLRQVAIALLAHHEREGAFPPSAEWSDSVSVETMYESAQMGPNWVIRVLPDLGEQPVYDRFDLSQPIPSPANRSARGVEIGLLRCPSDYPGVPYESVEATKDKSPSLGDNWARGNYAANGANGPLGGDGKSATPISGPDSNGWSDPRRKGVMGPNVGLSLREIADGGSKTMLLSEVRAGLNRRDRRGVWALGGAGSSVLYWHGWSAGAIGPANGPNDPSESSDDISGCLDTLIEEGGSSGVALLAQEKMTCRFSRTTGGQGGARSKHVHGVNVAMGDGSVRFVNESIETSEQCCSVWDRLILSQDGETLAYE